MKRTIVWLIVFAAGLALLVQPASAQFRRVGQPQGPDTAREGPGPREQALAQQVQQLAEQLKRIEKMLAESERKPDAKREALPPQADRQGSQAARGSERRRPLAGAFERGFAGRAAPLPGAAEGPRSLTPPGPPAPPQGELSRRGEPSMRRGPGREAPFAARPPFGDRPPLAGGPFAGRLGGPQMPRRPRSGRDGGPRLDGNRRPEPGAMPGVAAQVRQIVEDARRLLARAEQLERQLAGRGPEPMRQGPPRQSRGPRGR